MRGLLMLLLFVAGVRAEHRMALLIEQQPSDEVGKSLDPLQAKLEQVGFHCERTAELREKELKRTIESFCGRTPTAGTAMIVFAGQINKDGKLVGTDSRDDRGLAAADAFEVMSKRGGSRYNLLWVGSPHTAVRLPELPDNSVFGLGLPDVLASKLGSRVSVMASMRQASQSSAFTSNVPETVRLSMSRAISPPDKFVLGQRAGDEWVDPRGMVFCWVPPGRFKIGSPPDEPGRLTDETQREVFIERGFWMGKYEVTVRENHRKNVPHNAVSKMKNAPLTMVHHDDGKGWSRTWSENARKAGRIPEGWEYALCSESQWEYAARAGTATTWHFGNDPAGLARHANFSDKTHFDSGAIDSNYADRSINDGRAGLAEVGLYQPNPWGLHDMHGNVAEWCLDYAVKGGSYVSPVAHTRVAYRLSRSSRDVRHYVGYRVVIQPSP